LVMSSQPEPARRSGRPRQAQAEALSEQIVDAALECFTKHGFVGTTIEMVARRVGTTRRSVSYRFPDRHALLMAVSVRRLATTTAYMLSAPPPAEDALAHFRSLCRRMLEVAVDPVGCAWIRVVFGEVAQFPALGQMIAARVQETEREIGRIIVLAHATGRLQGRDPAGLANQVLGVFLSHPQNLAIVEDPRFRDPAQVDRYFELMWGEIVG
jgi:AcrR family transcriptional regulator